MQYYGLILIHRLCNQAGRIRKRKWLLWQKLRNNDFKIKTKRLRHFGKYTKHPNLIVREEKAGRQTDRYLQEELLTIQMHKKLGEAQIEHAEECHQMLLDFEHERELFQQSCQDYERQYVLNCIISYSCKGSRKRKLSIPIASHVQWTLIGLKNWNRNSFT